MSVWEWLLWMVPLAVLVAGIRDPRLGVEVLVAALPLFGSPPGGPYLGALDAAVIAVFLASRRGVPARSKLDWALLAFLVVAFASLFPLSYLPPSWSPSVLVGLIGTLSDVGRWSVFFSWRVFGDLLLGGMIFLAIRRAYSGQSPKRLGLALAAGVLATNVVGFAEQLGLLELGAYRPIGLALYDERFHSLFFHSGWCAEFLVLAAPLACAALLTSGTWGRRLALGLVGTTLAALLLSQQRGAWFAGLAQLVLAAGLMAPAILRTRARRRGVSVAAALTVAAAIALIAGTLAFEPKIADSLEKRLAGATSDLSNRTWVWKASVEMVKDRPLLGWGIGSFSPALDLRYSSGTKHHSSWLTAHSLYFMTLAERGLLGLASLALVLGLSTFGLLSSWRRARGEQRVLISGLLVSLCGLVVFGLVQDLFFVRSIGWLCWVLLGCVGLCLPRERMTRTDRGALGLVAVALLLLPIRALGFEPVANRGNRSYGFHAAEVDRREGAFRWTTGRAARRISWDGDVLILRLANGHPKAAVRPVTVDLRIDRRFTATMTLDGGWQEQRFELGEPTKESVLLELKATPVFRPFSDFRRYPDLPQSRDIRRLGVAFADPRWETSQSLP